MKYNIINKSTIFCTILLLTLTACGNGNNKNIKVKNTTINNHHFKEDKIKNCSDFKSEPNRFLINSNGKFVDKNNAVTNKPVINEKFKQYLNCKSKNRLDDW